LFFQRVDPEWDKKFILNFLPMMMVGLAFLMVSTISYPSFKQLQLERRKQFEVLPIIFLLVALVVWNKDYLEAIVFFGFVIYVMGGVFGHITRRWWHKSPPGHRVETAASPVPDAGGADAKPANSQDK